MKTLLKNGTVVNVFTGETKTANVLLENERILGVGAYDCQDADIVEELAGKFICPGLIDGHIHIESTMLQPSAFARACVPHGTTAVVADPHEIANVAGLAGLNYMLQATEGLPLTVYLVLPSCVPATSFDESGAALGAPELRPYYRLPRVLGLGEVMDYPGILRGDKALVQKLYDAKAAGKVINGHAPLLSGRDLDRYISAGILDDHECSTAEEARERIRRGQWVMIRQGTAARNLASLLPLFDAPYANRCLLVTDDRHPADLLNHGHIDSIIRQAVQAGKSAVTGIQMATIQAAQRFGLRDVGAVAPGYIADLLVLDDLDQMTVRDVYRHGERVVRNGQMLPFSDPPIEPETWQAVRGSFHLKELTPDDFTIAPTPGKCRVIGVTAGELLTQELAMDICWEINNGIDLNRDILKLAVIERHRHTGHIGRGFIHGTKLRRGAIASSVSHDSHNLIVLGTNDRDMALAANRVCRLGGGCVVAADGDIAAELPLPLAGLMSEQPAAQVAQSNELVRLAVHELGVPPELEPFMLLAFMSLPVIPHLKLTTMGLVDVDAQQLVPLSCI